MAHPNFYTFIHICFYKYIYYNMQTRILTVIAVVYSPSYKQHMNVYSLVHLSRRKQAVIANFQVTCTKTTMSTTLVTIHMAQLITILPLPHQTHLFHPTPNLPALAFIVSFLMLVTQCRLPQARLPLFLPPGLVVPPHPHPQVHQGARRVADRRLLFLLLAPMYPP